MFSFQEPFVTVLCKTSRLG